MLSHVQFLSLLRGPGGKPANPFGLMQETASPWWYTTLFMGLQLNGTVRIPGIHPAGSASREGNK